MSQYLRRLQAIGRFLAAVFLALAYIFALPAGAQTALTNGGLHTGDIAPAGDSESWTFTAGAGDGLFIRVGSTNFTPRIRLFDGTNAQIAETTSGNTLVRDGWLTLTATNGGNYTVIVSASFAGQTGTYGLHFGRAPGAFSVPDNDEGGELGNGSAQAGTLSLGDLDLWSFSAQAGEGLMLRVGATNFTPWLRLYGPTGALVAEETTGNTLARDGVITLAAPATGAYTLVVSATYSGQAGGYALHWVKAPGAITITPGDEGGGLVNGAVHAAALTLGDLDAWTFAAGAGDGLMIRMGATGLTPWLRLYGPSGALVAEETSGNNLVRDGEITRQAPATGTYTLVVSARYSGQTGPYELHLAKTPGDFVVSDGDEGGDLINGSGHTGNLTLGDLDLWRFTAAGGESVVFRVGATNFTPWIRLYGPTGALVDSTTSGNTLVRDGTVAATPPMRVPTRSLSRPPSPARRGDTG
mgnify:CR=1 FL=1